MNSWLSLPLGRQENEATLTDLSFFLQKLETSRGPISARIRHQLLLSWTTQFMVDLSTIPVDRADNNLWPVASLSLARTTGVFGSD